MVEEAKQHWRPYLPDQKKGLCEFESPDMHYRFYAKWDGDLHFWFYDNPWTADIRQLFGRREHDDYYWQIGRLEELDDMIARLQAIKGTAQQWFAERGERWPPDWESYDPKNDVTIEKITRLPQENQ